MTIREKEEIENEEERVEKEKQRQADLRKRESRRVCACKPVAISQDLLSSGRGGGRTGLTFWQLGH